jgi:hypothetical protein
MKKKQREFLVVWCSQGIEFVEDITDRDALVSWALLKGERPPKLPSPINHILLRARLNSHRFYEIYSVTAVGGIDKDDIVKMFEDSPQTAAETIRRLGNKIYSDRRDTDRIVIT